MGTIDRAHFNRLLLQRRESLLSVSETAGEAAATVTLDQSCVGRLSRMDALQSQAMSQESNRRRDLELQRIAAALSRVNEGDYGYCLDCGEEIADNRLEVDPAAPLCIQCAGKAENER